TLPCERVQPVATINYPDERAVPFTRTTEFKHLTGQVSPVTTIVRECPTSEGDPYYPIPRPENAERYRQYEELARTTPGVTFIGRLATYKYYNMDQVVAQALATYRRLSGPAERIDSAA
ncbi:MAG: UDP-galactopyranose mutase, partial [Chloroflexota bacterium]